MAATKENVLKLINYKGLSFPLLLSLLCDIGIVLDPAFAPFAAFFWLLYYDMTGYNFVLCRRPLNFIGWMDPPPDIPEAAYRWTSFWQGVKVVGTYSFIVWGFYGWINALFVPVIFFVLFLTGNKETLYYYFFHDPLADKWTWSKWTIVGKFIKDAPTANQMKWQMIIGDIIAILIVIAWKIFL